MQTNREQTPGSRLSFMVRSQGGHVVSWSLQDHATRIMLAHSRGRPVIDGRAVDFDPNVAASARIMETFFNDPMVEARLLSLLDAYHRGELEAEQRRLQAAQEAELPAHATGGRGEDATGRPENGD